ncbi:MULTISPECIES: hypothetical protein [Ramlibacter]|uniref:Group 1 truncated hemoglobin n=1 Tax=Ramlibacter pinisoli TaxID=2682844 RepID=A0A6N8J1L9_9BURK|nr:MULTISPECIES: hypothetical protein [Ramlibacter]MBA2963043.1 hypothetical protein [Ramlibacter sp. CGMCC 1.13660]MVQ32987.1 hypothetical protein [Ramlibacter pinisoli]
MALTFRPSRACLALLAASTLFASTTAFARDDDDSVAARLGGADGIGAFIQARVVPALLASELKVFFTGGVVPLTESTSQTVTCLARLLDHDLGGRSAKNGSVAVDAAAAPFPVEHQCRSSMSDVHRGMRITDAQFALFINIVATEALAAGVAGDDVQEVGKVLTRYRGSVTNH